MNLYEELGRIQYQIDKLMEAKESIVRRIEIEETIRIIERQKVKENEPCKCDTQPES